MKLRLLKTYIGQGTEYCDPADSAIRVNNFLYRKFGREIVIDESKIKKCHTNDVLIISGLGNTEYQIPVLHRSPPVRENQRRLLFTITIS